MARYPAKIQFEQAARSAFNKNEGTNAQKSSIQLRGKQHGQD